MAAASDDVRVVGAPYPTSVGQIYPNMLSGRFSGARATFKKGMEMTKKRNWRRQMHCEFPFEPYCKHNAQVVRFKRFK